MLKNTKNIVCNKGENANTLTERIIFECLDKLNIFKNQSKIQPIIFEQRKKIVGEPKRDEDEYQEGGEGEEGEVEEKISDCNI